MRFDPNYVVNLSQSLNSSSAAEASLTAELSSGLRVSRLSDDPGAAAQNVLLSQSISSADSFVQSAGRDQSLLQVTDSTLGEVVSSVTSAIALGVEGSSGPLTPANLNNLSTQLSSLRDTIVGLANTSYQGAHIFGGSKGNTAPYAVDSSTNPATTTYQGDSVVQKILTPDGQSIQVGVPGSAVFSAPGADLLGTLNKLVSDVASGNSAAASSDTSALTAALDNVSAQRVVLGSSLSRLNSTSSYASTQEAQTQAQQSTLLSADPAAIATNLAAAELQHQALLSVIATLSKPGLFGLIN